MGDEGVSGVEMWDERKWGSGDKLGGEIVSGGRVVLCVEGADVEGVDVLRNDQIHQYCANVQMEQAEFPTKDDLLVGVRGECPWIRWVVFLKCARPLLEPKKWDSTLKLRAHRALWRIRSRWN